MRSYEEVGVGILFDLVKGRCDANQTVKRLTELLREHDPELEDFLRDLGERRAARPLAEDVPAAPSDPEAASRAAPPDYTAAFARLRDGSAAAEGWVATDTARARRDLQRLLDLSTPEERTDAIRLSRVGMRSPALVEGLLDEAKRLRAVAPALALELTEAALLVAARVAPLARDRGARFRLASRAEAHRANVLRLLGELHAADSSWRLLAIRRERDPIDLPDEAAEVLSLEASLRIDLRQFDLAEELLARAEALYRRIGDKVGQAKVLLKRGSAAEHAGDSERAIGFHQRRWRASRRQNASPCSSQRAAGTWPIP